MEVDRSYFLITFDGEFPGFWCERAARAHPVAVCMHEEVEQRCASAAGQERRPSPPGRGAALADVPSSRNFIVCIGSCLPVALGRLTCPGTWR